MQDLEEDDNRETEMGCAKGLLQKAMFPRYNRVVITI